MTGKLLALLVRASLNLQGQWGRKVINRPFQTVQVPPALINRYIIDSEQYRHLKICGGRARAAGLISAEPWDRYLREVDQLPTARDFRKIFVEGKNWEETTYYTLYLKKGHLRDCSGWAEFKAKHAARWEALYQEIRDKGYRSQRELGQKNSANEVEIAVSAGGELLFIDGRHRFLIARILGIESIPVIVNLWHRSYIERIRPLAPGRLTPRTAIGPALEKTFKPAP